MDSIMQRSYRIAALTHWPLGLWLLFQMCIFETQIGDLYRECSSKITLEQMLVDLIDSNLT